MLVRFYWLTSFLPSLCFFLSFFAARSFEILFLFAMKQLYFRELHFLDKFVNYLGLMFSNAYTFDDF